MEVSSFFEELNLYRGKEYLLYKSGLPDSVLGTIDSLCSVFEEGSEDTRRLITSCVTREISYLFLMFADRSALEALRKKDAQYITKGLESLAIENCNPDWRDSTLRLVPLYHSAMKIGADPEHLISSVAAISVEPARTRLFQSFLKRSPEDRVLSNFGLKEAIAPDGNTFYTPIDQCTIIAFSQNHHD